MCDSTTFGRIEAKMACKSLLQDFVDGVPIRGGLFGTTDIPTGVNSIQCSGEFLSCFNVLNIQKFYLMLDAFIALLLLLRTILALKTYP